MADIEKISNQDIDIFQNDIDYYLKEFCEINDIDNLRNTSQAVFSACLMYIYDKCFKNTLRLKDINKRDVYNIDIIKELSEYYIKICKLYDKEITLKGFEYISGITQDTLSCWINDRTNAASPKASEIVKNLTIEREISLSDKLQSGRNPVGVLAILNHFYSWNMPGVREQATKSPGTLADLQKRAGLLSDNSSATDQESGNGSDLKLSDNLTQ